jgi:HD-like signal output (HDOD) protein
MDISSLKAKQLIKQFNIPAKPDILTAIQQELQKPSPDPIDYADIIQQDVALSALVLKVVNSPVYGMNKELSDIRKAVILLGLDSLNNLVTYAVLKQAIQGNACISLEKFWDNSMEIAQMSKLVHSMMSDSVSVKADDLYALCLFRDCGIPLMAMKYDDYRQVLMQANDSPEVRFTDIEEEYYPTNHATIGYFISSSWHLSKSMCELVLRHHESDYLLDKSVDDKNKDLYALMKIASLAASQYKYKKSDPEWGQVSDQVLAYFQISDLDFEEMIADLVDQFEDAHGDLGSS